MTSPKTRKPTPKQTPVKQPVAKTTEKATPVKKDVPALGKKAIEQKQELVNPEVPRRVVLSKELATALWGLSQKTTDLSEKAIEQKQELVNPEVPQQVVVSKELPQKTTMTLQELKDKMASAPFVPSNPLDRFFKR